MQVVIMDVDCIIRSQGAQEKKPVQLTDRFPPYSSFGKWYPLKKTYPSYSLGQGGSQGNTGPAFT